MTNIWRDFWRNLRCNLWRDLDCNIVMSLFGNVGRGFRACFLVSGLFCRIQAFVGDANQLIAVLAVLREGGDSVVHADGNPKLERAKNFREDHANTTAETVGLRGISLRKQQCEFVATDAEGGVGGTKSFLESGGSGAKNVVATRVAVLVVHFLKAVQIETHQTERVRIAASAIEFFIEIFVKETAVVQPC